jgi:iron-sulfur cluster assembly protein
MNALIFLLIVCLWSVDSFRDPPFPFIRRPSQHHRLNAGAISITEKAHQHLIQLKKQDPFYLRMGVKSGGCSGLSYVMNIVDKSAIKEEDHVENIDGINCIIDPKSLLYIFGLVLDYSDELIGGGFKFNNPNAETSW